MLLYSVNRDVGITMAKRYAGDQEQEKYEWLDLYSKKKRSNMKTIVMERSSLVQQLEQIR